MSGPLAVRCAIHHHLKDTFGPLLTDLRVEWDTDEQGLPEPVKYVPHEPDAIDVYPLIAVTTGVEATTRRIEHEADGGQFLSTYPIEVYVWTITDGREDAQDVRDRMAAAIKIALLSQPTFGGSLAGLDESTFTQSYSDIVKARSGDRFVAGSQSAFDVLVYEGLGSFGATLSPQVGTVSVYGVVDGSPFAAPQTPILPPHPALE